MERTTVLFTAVMQLIGVTVIGQTVSPAATPPPPPPTAIERALLTRETLAIKTSYDIGQAGKPSSPEIGVTALVVQFPQDQGRVAKGVKVEVSLRGEPDRPHGTAFLDLDECDRLVQALTTMLERADEWKLKAVDRTEVSYSTRGGLTVGFLQGTGPQRGFIQAGEVPRATSHVSIDGLREFSDLVSAAAAKLAAP